jgi:hypothetical protein
MQRDPPPSVKRQLRQEQGFVCVVPDCTNPYLYYHHFDPPWRVKHHHDPKRMVALCGEHHPKADAGAFMPEQLRDYKRRAAAAAPEVKGRFDWLRREIAIFSGGILYIENDLDVVVNGRPVLWFNRDDEGYALLNVRMPQAGPSKRVTIEDNSWLFVGNPVDVKSPPGGKTLEVRYRNGDYMRVRFLAPGDAPALQERFAEHGELTLIEVVMRVPEVGLDLRTDGFLGGPKISGAVVLKRNHIGLGLDIGPWLARRRGR